MSFGSLFVHVKGGTDLAAKDLNGKSDPYCVLSLDGFEQETSIKYKTLEPIWDEEFTFPINKKDPSSALLIKVWDWDKLSHDDFMGMTEIPLILFSDDKPKDFSLKVRSRPGKKDEVSGEIQLTAQLLLAGASRDSSAFDYETLRPLEEFLISLPHATMLSLFDAKNSQSDSAALGLISLLSDPTLKSDSEGAVGPVGKLWSFLSDAVQIDVSVSDYATTLFRHNSAGTKLITTFFNSKGAVYLNECVGEIVREFIREKTAVEVDPSKVTDDSQRKHNMQNLLSVCTKIMNSICASVPKCPTELRDLCQIIASTSTRRFPESRTFSVGAFVFLRFMCPAIMFPQKSGLVDLSQPPPTGDSLRGLTLVTKVLQNLANGVRFGSKESFLEPMNTFIDSNMSAIQTYFSDLATPISELRSAPPQLPIEELRKSKTEALTSLLEYFQTVLESRAKAKIAFQEEEESKRAFEALSQVVYQIAPESRPIVGGASASTTEVKRERRLGSLFSKKH